MDDIRTLLKESLSRSLKGLQDEDRLAAAWLVVCGPALAIQGRIVSCENGLVRVEVRDRVWLEQMRNMSGQLEHELARIAGIKVTKLHFVVKRNLSER